MSNRRLQNDFTPAVALGISSDDRQVRPGPTKPEVLPGLAARLGNEEWVSGFHRGQRQCRVQGRI